MKIEEPKEEAEQRMNENQDEELASEDKLEDGVPKTSESDGAGVRDSSQGL